MESRYITGAELIDNHVLTVIDLFKRMHEGILHAFTEFEGNEVIEYNYQKSDFVTDYYNFEINLHSLEGHKDIPVDKHIEIIKKTAKRGLEMARAEDSTKYPFPFDKAEQSLVGISQEVAREEIRKFLFLREEIDKLQKDDISPSKPRIREASLLTCLAGAWRKKLDSTDSPVGKIRQEIEQAGLSLDKNTVGKIVKEVKAFIEEKVKKDGS